MFQFIDSTKITKKVPAFEFSVFFRIDFTKKQITVEKEGKGRGKELCSLATSITRCEKNAQFLKLTLACYGFSFLSLVYW